MNITLTEAIRLHCLTCCGGKQLFSKVKRCTGKMINGSKCPLHPYRLGKGVTKLKLIKRYCSECLGGTQDNILDTCTSQDCAFYDYRYGKRLKKVDYNAVNLT